MITKRLMALIALASSAALAQDPQQPGDGNLPAPDLFDSQIVCSNALPATVPTPTVIPEGATESALDAAIGMGNVQINNPTLRNNLGFVIPAEGNNCGRGLSQTAFTIAGQGAVATDVATGYTALLPKFMAVYGDPDSLTSSGTAGSVARAREALARAEADETTSTAVIASLRRTLASAQERDTEARAEFNAIAQGPIYQAAAAEWMAKAAVTQSVSDYNDAVLEVNSAQTTLDTMNYSGYVPLGSSELIGTVVFVFDGMGTVNLSQLRQYINGDLSNPQAATVDDDGVTDTSQSNFDQAGNLVVPMRLVDGELQAVSVPVQVAQARANRDNHQIALAALKKLRDENQTTSLQSVFDDAVTRAQAEADHYEQQFQLTLADTTNRNPLTIDLPSTPENEAAPYSIASRHADYLTADNARLTAEATLRSAAATREAATQNVIEHFQNPGSFYAQLVARRQSLQTVADQAVADSPSPTMALIDAAAVAAEAVADAEEALAAYNSLVGDPDDLDNPVVDLVNTLLETDGDDGQAVVDAISQTYANTVENRDAVGALTADTEDGAGEDGPITANRKAIEANADDIESNAGDIESNADDIESNAGEIESLGGRVMQNEEDIGTLKEDTDLNTGMIATNAGNIASNASNVASNASNIAGNASNIVDNRSYIGQNAATLVNHGALIDRNAGHIALNSGRIGANAAAITMNSGLIGDNRYMIGELSSDLDVVRAGVAASIALSRMPSVDGGGISFGAGTYAGEMAYAVGFQVERGFGTFDIGVTSSGGEIGAGVGVGLKVWH